MYKTEAKVIIYSQKPIVKTGMIIPVLDEELSIVDVLKFEESEIVDTKNDRSVFKK